MDTKSPKWTGRFLFLAKTICQWSKDPSTKAGSVIVTETGDPVSFGYNGVPKKIADTEDLYIDRELKYLVVEHAERNAIFQATKSLIGCVIYVTHYPCTGCARAIIQSGITTVVVDKEQTIDSGSDYTTRWNDDIQRSKWMFDQAGVTVIESNRDENNEQH